jgi:hypothetical protein
MCSSDYLHSWTDSGGNNPCPISSFHSAHVREDEFRHSGVIDVPMYSGRLTSSLPISDPRMRANGVAASRYPMDGQLCRLLRVRCERPSRRGAECGEEFPPSKANRHLHLPRLPRTGSRLQGEGLRPNRNRIIMG